MNVTDNLPQLIKEIPQLGVIATDDLRICLRETVFAAATSRRVNTFLVHL